MDTARAQTVLGDGSRELMPELASIRSESATFGNSITTGPWTVPSHASMFTGQRTSGHRTDSRAEHFDPDGPPLAERLQRGGYQTVAFSNNNWVSEELGFDRGFEEFRGMWNLSSEGVPVLDVIDGCDTHAERLLALAKATGIKKTPPTLLNLLYSKLVYNRFDDGARETEWRARRCLSKHDEDGPFFMFLNYTEPHLEYDPPRGYWERHLPGTVSIKEAKRVPQNAWKYIAGCTEMSDREFDVLRALYKAELSYLDSRIGRLYDLFDRKGLLDSTWIVICSDHGENISDHDLMDHQYCLYDTLLRVPLIIRPPGGLAESRTVSDLVELRDLFPTVLDMAGLSFPSDSTVTQNSLLPAVSEGGQAAVGREFTVSEHPIPNLETLYDLPGADVDRVAHYERAIRCIRTNRFKFIERTDGTEALFDLRSDPGETDDLSQRRPELATRLRDRLHEECGDDILEEVAAQRSDDLSATTQKHLRDLGYVDV